MKVAIVPTCYKPLFDRKLFKVNNLPTFFTKVMVRDNLAPSYSSNCPTAPLNTNCSQFLSAHFLANVPLPVLSHLPVTPFSVPLANF